MDKLKVFFDKFQNVMEEKVVPVATRIASQKHLSALRDGLTILIPFTVIGGISLMIANPPVDLEVMKPTNFFFQFMIMWKNWATDWATLLTIPFHLTIGIISVYVVLGISYRFSKYYKMEALPNSLTALFVFLCVAGVPQSINEGSFIDVSGLGASSMFAAIIIALLVIEINHWMIIKNLKISMPKGVPPMVAGPFEVLLPLVVNTILFIVLDQVIFMITGSGLTNLVFTIFSPLISATASLPSMLFIVVLTVVFWFFGIHGANVVGAVWKPLLATMALANMEAFQAGLPLPYIVSDTFWGVYSAVFNFSIPLLLVLVCKSIRAKSIGKLSIVPAMFCIHEPFIFGLPVVLNTLLFIPFIFVYLLQFIVVYLLAVVQIAPIPVVPVPWTTPLILSGFLSTNFNIMGAVIQILLIVVGCIGYYPFIKAMDKQFLQEEKKELQEGNA